MVQKPPARRTRESRGCGLGYVQGILSVAPPVFGDQVEVIDRCHVVQQAVGALDGVLRSIKTQLKPEEAKELKKLRKRWLKLPNQLEVDELLARADWRQRFPELRAVIDWVQDLRKWFERK